MRKAFGLLLVIVMGLVGCGDDSDKDLLGSSNEAIACRSIADTHWWPDDYLAWRGTTRAIRNNSFTHAMPCSLELMAGRFDQCQSSERLAYYTLISKYDQFIAGWDDVTDAATGHPLTAYTEIDSVENFHSAHRMEYESCRSKFQ